MRKILITVLSVVVLGGLALSQAEFSAEPPLGDVARAQRTTKKSAPKRVFTNEDLAAQRAASGDVSETKPATATDKKSDGDAKVADAKDKKPSTAEAKSTDATKEPGRKDGDPGEISTAVEEKYRNAIRKQRETIAALEKEIDDGEHKVQVQSTNYYMDAGARYRDPKAWTEQREKMNKEIEAKREKLVDARVKLDGLLEEARKLGIPSRSLE